MPVEYLHTPNAPAAIGPYSQATRAGGFLFSAGQIALDPVTTQVVAGGVAVQTEQVMTNLRAVLANAGCTWDDVVKTTIFLASMDDFAVVNDVYGRHIGAAKPARSTVAVAGLPRGVRVEIECVAKLP